MSFKVPSFTLSRKTKIILGILIILFLAAGAVFFSWFSFKTLFTENPRFILKNVVVESCGWWNGKHNYIADKMELKKGSTILFAIDLEKIRKKLEEESSIEKVSVARKLPDTLVISITERIPRAMLHNLKSSRVLDSNSIVMQKEKCMNIAGNLPVIFGFRDRVPSFGQRFNRLQPAMDLIMMTITSFPDIRIASIRAQYQDYLLFSMFYKDNFKVIYRVYIPVREMRARMNALVSAMPEILRNGSEKTTIDLRYEGKVTLQ